MKYQYPAILAVLIVLMAMAVAGCTTTSPSAPAASTTPGGPTTAPAATGAPASGGQSTLGSLIDLTKVKWYEYRMNMSMPGLGNTTSDMRFDQGVDYNGTKANKMTMTSETIQGGATTDSLTEYYTSPTTGKTIGGHMQTKVNGKVTSDIPLTGTNGSETYTGVTSSDPFGEYTNSVPTNAGVESVTVPAGTYSATKYVLSTEDNVMVTVWIAPNVKVPVKETVSTGTLTISIDLVGSG